MKYGNKARLLALALLPLIFLSMVQGVSAVSSRFQVTIENAYYADVDGDGQEDDVIIEYLCEVTEGYKSPSKTDFYFTLTLPSGAQLLAMVTLVGKFDTIRIRLTWFDSAWESGWYNVLIDALAFGGSVYGYTTDSYDFDPPTGSGTGDPHIKVTVL